MKLIKNFIIYNFYHNKLLYFILNNYEVLNFFFFFLLLLFNSFIINIQFFKCSLTSYLTKNPHEAIIKDLSECKKDILYHL